MRLHPEGPWSDYTPATKQEALRLHAWIAFGEARKYQEEMDRAPYYSSFLTGYTKARDAFLQSAYTALELGDL